MRGGGGAGAKGAKGRGGWAKRLASVGRQKRRSPLLASRDHVVAARTKRTAAAGHPRRLGPSRTHRVRPGRYRMPLSRATGTSAPGLPSSRARRRRVNKVRTYHLFHSGLCEHSNRLADHLMSAAVSKLTELLWPRVSTCYQRYARMHRVYHHSLVLFRWQWAHSCGRGTMTAQTGFPAPAVWRRGRVSQRAKNIDLARTPRESLIAEGRTEL